MPFTSCSVCGRNFSRSDNMRRHKRLADGRNQPYLKINGAYPQANEPPPPPENTVELFKFQHPFTMIVAGPTMSGKSTWIKELLLRRKDFIAPPPDRIIWLYTRWQSLYDDFTRHIAAIEFIQGLPDDLNSDSFVNPEEKTLLIIDDLMRDSTKNQDVCEIFVEGAHHRNLSTACIMQNLYNKGKENRTMSLNTQYLILFKNPRDQQQIMTLARQMYPGNSGKLIDTYQKAVEIPHGSLVINFKQMTPESQRLRPNIFKEGHDVNLIKCPEPCLENENRNATDTLEHFRPFCMDCGIVFATSYDLACHTMKGCKIGGENEDSDDDSDSDTESVGKHDFELHDDDTSGFDIWINEVRAKHDPIFQQKVTELTDEGMPEEEARNVAREKMLDTDRNLFFNIYKDILKSSVLLMHSSLNRKIRQEILRLVNLEDTSVGNAILQVLNQYKHDFDHLFVEN